ncbi:MAG: methionyl-tRNA formyltransferase [Clostridia bacterium]|nr:methionyl-tRNA formyltransferase [Clostridia bacterium]
MKIVYAGTPEYAVAPLEALVGAGYDVIAVITAPDRPVGRGALMTPPPVKTLARKLGVPVFQFDKVSLHAEELRGLGADLMVTCAYGQILSDEILEVFPMGVWNLHASLLPKYRGASPIQTAIMEGEEHTGVTVMKTERKLDAGDILLVKRCEIGDKTCGELEKELSLLSAAAAIEAMVMMGEGEPQLLLQDEAKATYCKKISKADAKIDFSSPAGKICRLINAMNPDPLAYCEKNGIQVNILGAEPSECDGEGKPGEVLFADKRHGIIVKCGDGAVKILSAQFPGGKKLSDRDLVNGRKFGEGDILS